MSGQYTKAQSLKRGVWKMLLLPRRLRLRLHETLMLEYAIVNDSGLHYSLLLKLYNHSQPDRSTPKAGVFARSGLRHARSAARR